MSCLTREPVFSADPGGAPAPCSAAIVGPGREGAGHGGPCAAAVQLPGRPAHHLLLGRAAAQRWAAPGPRASVAAPPAASKPGSASVLSCRPRGEAAGPAAGVPDGHAQQHAGRGDGGAAARAAPAGPVARARERAHQRPAARRRPRLRGTRVRGACRCAGPRCGLPRRPHGAR